MSASLGNLVAIQKHTKLNLNIFKMSLPYRFQRQRSHKFLPLVPTFSRNSGAKILALHYIKYHFLQPTLPYLKRGDERPYFKPEKKYYLTINICFRSALKIRVTEASEN